MADSPQTTVTDTVPAGSQLDQLSHLHRMSRTAGLGSSEYSAVNTAAVVAVLIGAASGLALMSPVFLILPVVGVVIAGIATKQIISSNGTQTGLPLALLALVLSVGLAGFTGVKALGAARQEKADNAALEALVDRFGKLLSEQKYDEAYALTDARFQEQVKKDAVEKAFESFAASPSFGRIKAMRTNKIFAIEADPDTGLRMAMGFAFFDFEKNTSGPPLRTELRYRFTNDEWKIYSIPQLFAPKPAAGAGGGGAPTGAAGPPAG